MKKLLLVGAVALFGFSTTAQNVDMLLDHYIDVKNALVKADGPAASRAAQALYESTQKTAKGTAGRQLLNAVEKLQQASGVKQQRAVLNDVSTALWQVIKSSDALSQSVYYQYCPMKKSYWLSLEKEIRNPYYGSSMLTCGKVAATKEP